MSALPLLIADLKTARRQLVINLTASTITLELVSEPAALQTAITAVEQVEVEFCRGH